MALDSFWKTETGYNCVFNSNTVSQETPTMTHRLDENTKTVNVLRQKFESGEIGPDNDTRTVQGLDQLFMEY